MCGEASATSTGRQNRPKAQFFSSQIIAILAAILFPVFARAREKARQTSCLSNLKQLALAARMYTDDYDETMVPALCDWTADYAGRTNELAYWGLAIEPYVKNDQLFICPSSRETYANKGISRRSASYGMNAVALMVGGTGVDTIQGGWASSPRGGVALSKIDEPSATILFGDASDNYWTWNIFYGVGGDGSHWTDSRIPVPVHNGGANFCFVDGHAKWLKKGNYSGRGGYHASLPAEGSPGRLYWSCQK